MLDHFVVGIRVFVIVLCQILVLDSCLVVTKSGLGVTEHIAKQIIDVVFYITALICQTKRDAGTAFSTVLQHAQYGQLITS